MKLTQIIFIISGFIFSAGSVAQNITQLPKNWKGISTGTSVGVTIGHNPNNPSSPDKGKQGSEFNTFEVPGTLEVMQQKGRHLDLIFPVSLWQNAIYRYDQRGWKTNPTCELS